MSRLRNGLLQLQSVPPGWGLTFSSYPLRLAKIAFTPEDFRKIWVYPWRIGSYPWRIWVYPWRILWKLRLHPQRIPYFFTLPLKKSSIFITYPWRIPWFVNRGGGGADIKCNSPMCLRGCILTICFRRYGRGAWRVAPVHLLQCEKFLFLLRTKTNSLEQIDYPSLELFSLSKGVKAIATCGQEETREILGPVSRKSR